MMLDRSSTLQPAEGSAQRRGGAKRRPRRKRDSSGDTSITARPLQKLTPSPLNVVNVPCSVFKAQERGKARAGARFVGELRPYERSRCAEHGRVAGVIARLCPPH